MSISTATSKVNGLLSDISRIQSKAADIAKKIASESDKIARATSRTASRNPSESSLRSARSDIERAQKEIARLHKLNGTESQNLARKQTDFARAQKDLMEEQQKQTKEGLAEIKKGQDVIRRLEAESRDRSLSAVRSVHFPQLTQQAADMTSASIVKKYTAFISHASEDKAEIARPLSEALRALGHEIWFDEMTLKVGDSLRRTIDHGLSNSRFGIVILSPSFFAKGWPQYELDGMVAMEVGGSKVILPLWHKVSKAEVISYSPSLGDKMALSTAMFTVVEIADRIHEVLSESLHDSV